MMYTDTFEEGNKLRKRRKENFFRANICVLFESFTLKLSLYTAMCFKQNGDSHVINIEIQSKQGESIKSKFHSYNMMAFRFKYFWMYFMV